MSRYCAPRLTDPKVVARMLAGNRALFERNREIGGTLYPFSAVGMSGLEWQQHYGTVWPALAHAKRRHDPDRVLASGPTCSAAERAEGECNEAADQGRSGMDRRTGAVPRAAATLGLEFIDADVEKGTIELAFAATEAFTNPAGNVLGAFVAAMLYDTVGRPCSRRSSPTSSSRPWSST